MRQLTLLQLLLLSSLAISLTCAKGHKKKRKNPDILKEFRSFADSVIPEVSHQIAILVPSGGVSAEHSIEHRNTPFTRQYKNTQVLYVDEPERQVTRKVAFAKDESKSSGTGKSLAKSISSYEPSVQRDANPANTYAPNVATAVVAQTNHHKGSKVATKNTNVIPEGGTNTNGTNTANEGTEKPSEELHNYKDDDEVDTYIDEKEEKSVKAKSTAAKKKKNSARKMKSGSTNTILKDHRNSLKPLKHQMGGTITKLKGANHPTSSAATPPSSRTKKINNNNNNNINNNNNVQTAAYNQGYSAQPIQKAARQPIQKEAKQPVQTAARQPIHKEAKQPLQTAARQPIHKEIKQPVQNAAKQPIQKVAKQPVQKEARQPLQKEARQPIQNQARLPQQKDTRQPIQKEARPADETHPSISKIIQEATRQKGGIPPTIRELTAILQEAGISDEDLAEFESGTPWNCDDIECEFNDLPDESEEEEESPIMPASQQCIASCPASCAPSCTPQCCTMDTAPPPVKKARQPQKEKKIRWFERPRYEPGPNFPPPPIPARTQATCDNSCVRTCTPKCHPQCCRAKPRALLPVVGCGKQCTPSICIVGCPAHCCARYVRKSSVNPIIPNLSI